MRFHAQSGDMVQRSAWACKVKSIKYGSEAPLPAAEGSDSPRVGASGGVGVAALQNAKVVGAQVIAVSASQDLLHTACFKQRARHHTGQTPSHSSPSLPTWRAARR